MTRKKKQKKQEAEAVALKPLCPHCQRATVRKLRGAFKEMKCPKTGGVIKLYKAACYWKDCRSHFVLREITPPEKVADSAIIE